LTEAGLGVHFTYIENTEKVIIWVKMAAESGGL
jgi:hypothetical protein